MAGFSLISLGSLWMFSLGWIHLQAEYAAQGATFGAPYQLGLAWAGCMLCLPALIATVFLAIRALQLPRAWFRIARG